MQKDIHKGRANLQNVKEVVPMRRTLALAIFIAMFLCMLPQFCCSEDTGMNTWLEKATAQAPQVYFGVYAKDVTKFEQDANKKVSIIHWFQQWGGTNKSFDTASLDQVRGHGAIPLLSWEPWKGLSYGTSQPTYSLQNIIDGNFDTYITKFAQDAKAWQYPFFLRFAHEMNGDWYPWSEVTNGNSQGQYVQAWKHVHDIFTSVGANNVSWVWGPGRVSGRGLSLKDLPGMYPGDSYVDWVAMDGYNAGNDILGWQFFSEVFTHLYNKILSITSKPMMIAETSCGEYGGGQKDQWITDALSTQLPANFTKIKGLVWFNNNNDPTAPWEIESSPSAQSVFAEAIQSPYFGSNNYYDLSQSPIPIPENVLGATYSLSHTLTAPSTTTVSRGATFGPITSSITNNTSSSYSLYLLASVYTPKGSWVDAIQIPVTLSAGQAVTKNDITLLIPAFADTGTYYFCEYLYDTSSNEIDHKCISFTVQ
jgi:mannan endo-1,4-beta-mannosidase